ncbi:MAG: aldehyde dehydrogenase EutE [Eubacterium sp.]|nr:aldehyde dehydrogenase EutE [Eubacterium sp.]MBR3275422.1 aldehyde dehydrogenase EutE [Eubacterium sp.]
MLSREEIEKIVDLTIARMREKEGGYAQPAPERAAYNTGGNGWMFERAEDAIDAAAAAQKKLMKMTMEDREGLIRAMRAVSIENAEKLARMAHEETGYGKVPDKIEKILLVAKKTPGTEDLKAEVFTGDRGLTLVERAPFGVIGSITPSTNPPGTIINNSISMIAAGNAVVFNPHPSAVKCCQETMRILNEAIVKAGGPMGLICCPAHPDMDTSAVIMNSPKIKLLSVTGGEAVVSIAMKTGKKCISAGPGNPPVIVDETADIEKAGKYIVEGASFDNNVLCVAEKECFIVYSVFDRLMSEMQKNGAFLVSGGDIDRIVNTVLVKKDGKYVINRDFVGHDATYILDKSGVSYTGNPRLVIAEVPKEHPFVQVEMLMPVLGCVRVSDVDTAIDWAVEAEHGCWHSAMIHSTNVVNMTNAARALNTSIFVKNGPSTAGVGYNAEGFATLTIATPTGEGLTSAKSFTRIRRCIAEDSFRIV